MSIPRITQILESKTLDDVESKELLLAWASDVSENLDMILIELEKFNLSMALFTGRTIKNDDIMSSRSDHGN